MRVRPGAPAGLRRGALGLALVAGLLSACAGARDPGPLSGNPATARVARPVPLAPPAARADAEETDASAWAALVSAPDARAPVPEAEAPPSARLHAARLASPETLPSAAPPIDDDPERLIGLDAAGLSDILGPPTLLRRDAPAEVWQYAAQDCVMDVYLYTAPGDPGDHRVTYYEMRDSRSAPVDGRRCLGSFLLAWQIAAAP